MHEIVTLKGFICHINEILSSTASIENNKTKILEHQILILELFEGSCDTENWNNDG